MGQVVSSILPPFVVNFFSTIYSALSTIIVFLISKLFASFDSFETKTFNFFDLVYGGEVDELSALIDSLSDDELELLLHMKCPDEVDDYRETALVIAVIYGHAEVVALLLEKGADPQEGCRQMIALTPMNVLPLWQAVFYRHLEVCRHLINYGANVNGGTDSGETPLLRACYKNNLDIVSASI
uniref:ANK_REP_REGION domain-containing protein n=1 Tax=Globodera pallida TaxID=36090 RepID=A0A183C138_GLOPA